MQAIERAGAHLEDVGKIVGPVGLINATRDPQTLAVSILAQVLEALREARSMSNAQHRINHGALGDSRGHALA
jgi:xanthine/CO dehydrogenase XdhC/CoxF family maturation factor